MNLLSQNWRKLSITTKFTAAFSLLLALIVLVGITSYIALAVIHRQTESAILTSTEIQRIVLEMDGDMEKARRLQRDFFLQYFTTGYSKASQPYARLTEEQILNVIELSAELQQLLMISDVSESLRKSRVNLNFYLSAAQRYLETFHEMIELVTRLTADDAGLQAKLARHATSLYHMLQNTRDYHLLDLYRQIQILEKEYWNRRQRHIMQSAFNTAFLLRQAIENMPDILTEQKDKISLSLDQYESAAQEIVRLDVAIRSKFNEFESQIEAVDPIAAELIALARQEVEHARNQISRTSRIALVILSATVLAGLMSAGLTAVLLNSSITRNVVRLTRAAAEFRSDWEISGILKTSGISLIKINSTDELGQLADSFNAMATRINALVGSLEQKVAERTAELMTSNKYLQQEISERKQAEEAAEAANQAKSIFLANMSHELRTPLNAILGYAQILQQNKALNADHLHRLGIIHSSGRHLLTLISDILDLSKIEAGKMELLLADIHVPSFLEGIASIVRARAEEKSLDFTVETHYLPDGIQADEVRLRQVLLNLLSNAVKFTKKGGVILRIMAVAQQEDRDFRINNFTAFPRHRNINHTPSGPGPCEINYPEISELQAICFEVADTGVGIPPDELDHVFQPFEQAGNIMDRAEGTGLGLSITQNLVNMMGGKLNANSTPGHGTTFQFELSFPVVAAEAKEMQSDQEITGYSGPRRNILVADDKPDNRMVLFDMLKLVGCEAAMAENGQEAVARASEILPDLILMDLVMPVMTGFEAVQMIRREPALQDVPIIAVSASVLESDRHRSLVAGCDAFLPKPVQAKDLYALLEKHLDITWTYAEPATGTLPENAPQEPLVPPPPEELAVLHEMALIGDMSDIGERALHIVSLSEQYRCFGERLHRLAKGFEEKEILALVEHFMEKGDEK